jgi:CheY-like chemotaxis protein
MKLTIDNSKDKTNKSEIVSPQSLNSIKIKEKSKKIIIVDDNIIINDSNKRLVNQILTKKGFESDIVQLFNGLELIKYILNYQNKYEDIKIIITDESMDYMDGSEAITFIRKYEKVKTLKHTKIVSLTCYENLIATKNILNAGADIVLSKPVSKSKLEGIINDTFVNID